MLRPSDIAAVVVTYFPDADVRARLRSYARFVGRVVVVDNSEPPVDAAEFAAPGVFLVPLGRNRGVAAALNAGVDRAEKLGHSHAVLLDQDSHLDADALAAALGAVRPGQAITALRVRPLEAPAPRPPLVATCRPVDVAITSGSVLDLSAFRRCGPFDEKLFIDYVDHDYCLRLRRCGFSIVQCIDAFLPHALGEPMVVEVLGHRRVLSSHRPFRLYYITRNGLHIVASYGLRNPGIAFRVLEVLVKEAVKAVFVEDATRARWGYILRGVRDWSAGRYGPLQAHP